MKSCVVILIIIGIISGGVWWLRHSNREVVYVPQARVARITFVEGKDVRGLEKLLSDKQIGAAGDVVALVGKPATIPTAKKDWSEEFEFLKGVPKKISYEGYLFPDTYEVDLDKGVEPVIRAMLRNFERRVTPDMRKQAAAQGRTLHQVVTMASIIEDEVRGSEDRRIVSDLLWRRYEKGMGLQVDASINYITGKSGRFTTSADRAKDSLWNTYKYRGLPVGPIGNPGLDAIQAALNPKPNSYWYYLTAPDGKVYYARTLEEHVANKKYLQ